MAQDPDCIFCKIVAGELPSLVVAEDDDTVAFLDVNPATPGHTVVIPKAHHRDLLTIDDDALQATLATARRVAATASDRLDAVGINLVNNCGAGAWQTVFHFHVHVIPRYEDDPLRLPWVPTPGDRDEITATHARLTA
ncbi:HIT family protein [Patulibacter minatonensis]|uniref:HIT family protein n=1 Tax=Patulibacter minatonensis TaxID=298163 RepID=UPI000479FE3F|nr:HIT domain-containing protein [Patulibacter minatonensis]